MKIALTLGSINRGGTETLLMDVIQNIENNSVIVVYRKSGVFEDELLKLNIKSYILDKRNVLFKIIHLRKIFSDNQIDIVHAHQPLDAFFAILANFGTKRKTVLTVHGFEKHESFKFKLLLWIVLHFTNKNIFVSNYQKNIYQKKYKLTSFRQNVVYNGINFNKIINSGLSDNFLKKQLNLENETILLGSVGNFVPVRNQLFLCHFIKMLKAKHVNFHFVFVGKKSEKYPELYDDCYSYCKNNDLSNHVTFLGARNDVPNILKELDCFLYASDHDTFGIAVVEAIATGIPVFVNDLETMMEITDQGKLANIYKSNDVNDLIAIFEGYLSEKEYFNEIALNNAEIVRKKYAIQNHIANLIKVFNTL